MSDDVTRLAEVLAEHENAGSTIRVRHDGEPRMRHDDGTACTHDLVHVWACTCGYVIRADEASAIWHEEHVATHIAPLIAEARLLGATQAKSDAIDAHAELVARMEALIAPGVLPDGEQLPEWVHVDEIRAALNDPTEETP